LDELCLTLAPIVVGGQGLRSTSGAALPVPSSFRLHHALYADDGALFTDYRIAIAPSTEIPTQF
jgi:riboflavin biosynthesis pyrimidine reductase